eukprot:TRINITY_DN4162_c0_g1_i1.p1 TRINITY_DN4162_c0_g1~~TRINITY_DN4162_c0_g1_i1.p1  ORF type:complete len:1335 (+),score=143.87 TRINITY_DN4162_c0_g1_i1:63-4067(+)
MRHSLATIGFLIVAIVFTIEIRSQAWTEIAKIASVRPSADGQFGSSVSITERFILIGEPGSISNTMESAGAAYIFTRSANLLTGNVILEASNKQAKAYFGCGVSLTENYAMVGASGASVGVVKNTGSAYVFARVGSSWTQQAILFASNRRPDDYFGGSVSLVDEYALVGAFFANVGELGNAGSAYVFSRTNSTWTQSTILTASNKSTFALFGYSVALTNQYALVGAYYSNAGSFARAGSAYIFTRVGFVWSEQAILTASRKQREHHFGYSLAISNQYAAIGSEASNDAYIFYRSGNTWVEVQSLITTEKACGIAISDHYALFGNLLYIRLGKTWSFHTTLQGESNPSVAVSDNFAVIGRHVQSIDLIPGVGEAYLYASADLSSLLGLYASTNGSYWIDSRGWDSSLPLCSWFGITCNPSCTPEQIELNTCGVYEIDLSGNNLQGTLPELYLPDLLYLHLDSNKLQGRIPTLLLENICELSISHNELNGSIPALAFENLRVLDLSHNFLTGKIPDLKTSRLTSINLSGNLLSGTIPELIMHVITFMDLSFNNLTGCIPDFTMPRTLYLDLSDNMLQCTIPDFSMPYISTLDLSFNRLEGAVSQLEASHLVELHLSFNLLTGKIPVINSFVIDSLLVNDNNFSGLIPLLPASLVDLDLSNNPSLKYPKSVLSDIFETTGGMLWLNKTNWLSNLSVCKWYGISCHASCSDIQFESSLCPIVKILLGNNNLVGSLASDFWLAELEYLEELDLSQNKLQGTVPELKAPSLLYLYLNHNQLSGSVPSWSLKSLIYLYLNNNNLTVISDSLDLPFLTLLDLSRNQIEGTLPSLNALYSLVRLDVSFNRLAAITSLRLPRLQTFLAFNNQITGSLPELELPKLSYLDFSNNHLSEPLPDWTMLTSMEHFIFSSNPRLKGPLPRGMDQYYKISGLNLKNTDMHSAGPELFPKTLSPSGQFQLLSLSDFYQCPIMANLRVEQSSIHIHPKYYDFFNCRCLPGKFGLRNRCVECPNLCDCNTGLKIWGCFPSPNLQNVSVILNCPNPSACITSIPSDVVLSKNNSAASINSCSDGYEGRVCAKCQSGYTAQGRLCQHCSPSLNYLSFTLGPLFILIFVVYLYKSESRASGKMSITIFHLQTLSIIISSASHSSTVQRSIEMPVSVSSIQISNISCLTEITDPFVPMLLSYARLPILGLIGFFAHFASNGPKKDKVHYVIMNLVRCMHYSIALESMGVFSCTLLDQGVDRWYFNAWPWISCQSASEEQATMIVLSVLVFICFVCGYPLWMWWIIKQSTIGFRQERNEQDRLSLRARYGFLYLPYKKVSQIFIHNQIYQGFFLFRRV